MMVSEKSPAQVKTVPGKIKSLVLSDLEVKQAGEGEFRISGYASKPVVDRVGDIVDITAFQNTMEEFKENPVMLWMHDATEPIGQWDTFDLRRDGLYVSGTLVEGTAMAEKARTLIAHKAVRALSIGFREIDGGPEEDGHYHIRRLRLFEISVVSVPANQAALFTLDKAGKCTHVELVEDDEELDAEEKESPVPDFSELSNACAATAPDTVDGLIKATHQNLTSIGQLTAVIATQAKEIAALKTLVEAQVTVLAELEAQHNERLEDLEKSLVKLLKGQVQRLVENLNTQAA